MAAPKTPKGIFVKVTNGNAGEYVKATNVTSGGTVRGKIDSNGETILNPAKGQSLTWNEDDKVQVSIAGRITQNVEATIKKGGASVTLDNSADTNIPSVTL